VNWSSYHDSAPPAGEEYDIHGQLITVEPEPTRTVSAPVQQRSGGGKKKRGPEFYKPFHLILMAYLYLYCSRIPELIPSLHLGMAIQPILLIGMFMTGTTKSIFKSDIGRVMTAFTIWVGICVPLSVWKGGSFTTWLSTAQALLLLFFMAAFIRSIEDCYRAMFMVALGMATIGVLSMVIGGGTGGGANEVRLGLGAGADTLADANFLALYLVVGIPFIIFAMTLKKGIMRVGLFLCLIPVLAGFSRTGSRMGMLALAAGMLLFFIFATMVERMAIIMGGIIFVALAVTLLPQRITERFTTFLNASSTAQAEAANSAEMRKALFLRSIQMSFEHPVFGVGPGEFMDAEAQESMAAGKRAMWHFTHNSYTELSSETGFPGLLLFLYAFYRGYRGLSGIRTKYRYSRVGRAALYLQIAVVMSCVGAFFLSIAYSGLLYAILGISAAYQAAVAQEVKAAETEKLKAAASEPEPAFA
jgi:putative inorganic carbon (HCO3(-)) transporter